MNDSVLARTFEMLVERLTALETSSEAVMAGQDRLMKAQALAAQREVRVVADSGLHLTFTDALVGDRVLPEADVNYYGIEDGLVQAFPPHKLTSVMFECPPDWDARQDEYLAVLTARAETLVAKPGVSGVRLARPDEYEGFLELRVVTDGRALWWDEALALVLPMVEGVLPDANARPYVLIDPGHFPDNWLWLAARGGA